MKENEVEGEIIRWVDSETGNGWLVKEDGKVYLYLLGEGWRLKGRINKDEIMSLINTLKEKQLRGEVFIGNTPPSLDQMEEWIYDGIAEAVDGCRVEPDGVCPHGHRSWLDIYGLI